MESQKGNVDFRDLLRRFADENVRYLIALLEDEEG
jgi:hypothetical protein